MRTKNGIVVKHGIAPLLELQRKRNATHLVLRLEREYRAVVSRMAGWQCERIAPPTTPLAIPRHSVEHPQTAEFLDFSGEAGGQIRVELTSLWMRRRRSVKSPVFLRCDVVRAPISAEACYGNATVGLDPAAHFAHGKDESDVLSGAKSCRCEDVE